MSVKMIMSSLQLPGYRSSSSTNNGSSGSGVVGLQALLLADSTAASLLRTHHRPQNNLLVTKSLTAVAAAAASPSDDQLLLLQSCGFCSTKLSPKKEVYMYRGDQGFCSRQCRDKQMKLDEIKQMEESTLIFHLKNSYHSNRHRRQLLKKTPLLEIGNSSSNNASVSGTVATANRRQDDHGCSRSSNPRRGRNPISVSQSKYYNRPLPLPPHQRLVYDNLKQRRFS